MSVPFESCAEEENRRRVFQRRARLLGACHLLGSLVVVIRLAMLQLTGPESVSSKALRAAEVAPASQSNSGGRAPLERMTGTAMRGRSSPQGPGRDPVTRCRVGAGGGAPC